MHDERYFKFKGDNHLTLACVAIKHDGKQVIDAFRANSFPMHRRDEHFKYPFL
jgi:hypothetical protein